MTGQITYDAHTSRIDDFHRRAAEHRRAASSKRDRRRLVSWIRIRRAPAAAHSATTTA